MELMSNNFHSTMQPINLGFIKKARKEPDFIKLMPEGIVKSQQDLFIPILEAVRKLDFQLIIELPTFIQE